MQGILTKSHCWNCSCLTMKFLANWWNFGAVVPVLFGLNSVLFCCPLWWFLTILNILVFCIFQKSKDCYYLGPFYCLFLIQTNIKGQTRAPLSITRGNSRCKCFQYSDYGISLAEKIQRQRILSCPKSDVLWANLHEIPRKRIFISWTTATKFHQFHLMLPLNLLQFQQCKR